MVTRPKRIVVGMAGAAVALLTAVGVVDAASGGGGTATAGRRAEAAPSQVGAGAPARFGPEDEVARLARLGEIVTQLEYLEGVFAGATGGSPAQFRARESMDSLREELRLLAR